MLDDLLKTLTERGIEPIGAECVPRSVHTEHRVVSFVTEPANQDGLKLVAISVSPQTPASVVLAAPSSLGRGKTPPASVSPMGSLSDDGAPLDRGRVAVTAVRSRGASLPSFDSYVAYAGLAGNDPRVVSTSAVSEGVVRIIEVEGPVVAKRVYDIYLRGSGIKRMGHELKSIMNRALMHAIRQGRVVSEDETAKRGLLFSVVRVKGSPPIKLRSRGPRSFEEIPPSELKALAKYLVERHGFMFGSEAHLRAVLECFDLKRLTTQVDTTLKEILERSFPYVDDFLSSMHK